MTESRSFSGNVCEPADLELAPEQLTDDPFAEYHNQPYRWVILAVYCALDLIMIFCVMCTTGLSARFIMDGMTPQDFSLIQTIGSMAGFILCFFAGALTDRIGAKNVMIVAIILGIIGAYMRVVWVDMQSNIMLLAAGNFLIGGCFGGLNCTVAKILNMWFSPKQFNFGMGLYVALATIGSAVALSSGTFFPDTGTLMWVCVGAMVVGALLIVFLLKNAPKGMPSLQTDNYLRTLGRALKYRSVWVASLLYFCLYGAYVAINIFAIMLFMSKGLSELDAATLSTIVVLGSALGSIVLPAIISRTGKSRLWLIILAFLAAAIMFVGWNVPYGIWTNALMLLELFVIGGCLSQTKALPAQLPDLPKELVGTAGGFQATLQNLGSFVLPTYVLSAIAGPDFLLLGNLIAVGFLVYAVITLFVPKDAGLR